MLGDRILVAEQSVIWQLKRSCNLQRSTLALTGLDRQLDRPNPINGLVMSVLFWICLKIQMRMMAVGSVML